MRSTCFSCLFVVIFLLNFLLATAIASLFSSPLSFALSHSRSILVTAARTQAIKAFFTGLDETKKCLQNQARQNKKQDASACLIGPTRALLGAYFACTDLNEWFFGNSKTKDTVKKGIRVVGRAATTMWLLKGGLAKKMEKQANSMGNSKPNAWNLWMTKGWKEPTQPDSWRKMIGQNWNQVKMTWGTILREGQKSVARSYAERAAKQIRDKVYAAANNGEMLTGVWRLSQTRFKVVEDWITDKLKKHLTSFEKML